MQLYISNKTSLSDFKLNKLIKDLIDDTLQLQVSDCFVVTLNGTSLEDNQKSVLAKLLNNADLYSDNSSDCLSNKHYCFISPRKGTISPWSSKAIDLAHLAGCSQIKVLEKVKLIKWNKESGNNKEHIIGIIEKIREIYDPLLENIVVDYSELSTVFDVEFSRPKETVYYNLNESINSCDKAEQGFDRLKKVNKELNLALSDQELDYLVTFCKQHNHCLSDVELMMFAQANSEHCRHKIFNASWDIDGIRQKQSLFKMIKNTYQVTPHKTIKAYKDNGAVVNTFDTDCFWPDNNRVYNFIKDRTHTVIKVETHNHPTAISPFPGAATGSGGEIRDEGATGRGAEPKVGLVGFSVSNLNIINTNTWENNLKPPSSMQSALNIMLDGPVGAARFNNEFGRPCITGYFRDFCVKYKDNKYYGYHKPIMLAGGLGTIRTENTEKFDYDAESLIIVLGGPALLIGLGGGAASSNHADLKSSDLDFASVQRDNAEMQRRCQEVINHCARSNDNPILSIHDVGAGGLSNAIPEIINDSACGVLINLDQIPTNDQTLSPLELWCNEAQERYVLVINQKDLDLFDQYCKRESCPYAVLGVAKKHQNTAENKLILQGSNNTNPIDLPMDMLFGNTPKVIKTINTFDVAIEKKSLFANKNMDGNIVNVFNKHNLDTIAKKILSHPTVASKKYLITIGDRSVGGLVAQDQMIGPYQVPVANCGVTLSDYNNVHGEAVAIGERTPLAIINPKAAARMAVGEAITNILAADIHDLTDIKLSANWMVASGEQIEDLALYDAVRAIGEDFCPKLGLCIPVGKDSMSMRTKWNCPDTKQDIEVKSPVSLIISAFGKVRDARKTLTAELKYKFFDKSINDSELWFIDLSNNNNLYGSIFAQVTESFFYLNDKKQEQDTIDISPDLLKQYFDCIVELKQHNLIGSYHDRSDGGLWATLCEMAFTNQIGLDIYFDSCLEKHTKIYNDLFNEGLGAVVQVKKSKFVNFLDVLKKHNLEERSKPIADFNKDKKIRIIDRNSINKDFTQKSVITSFELKSLYELWSKPSYTMQRLRDNPKTADQELISDLDNSHKLNLSYHYSIKPNWYVNNNLKPKAVILREQGTNGHKEMAASFTRAGFDCYDIHMNDIINNNINFDDYNLLAVCGGFSYGDVLGAGRGWAARILYHQQARDIFAKFFERSNTLTLGVCNGCQMLSHLKELIPGADLWPEFINNESEQFEARLSAVKINKSKSVLLDGMAGSILPIVVSHGEGRASFNNSSDIKQLLSNDNISMQFVDHQQRVTERYPSNPNGSPLGITGLCSDDGRVTIMMPHPERVFRSVQLSWCPDEWLLSDDSPWMRMFYNSYKAFK